MLSWRGLSLVKRLRRFQSGSILGTPLVTSGHTSGHLQDSKSEPGRRLRTRQRLMAELRARCGHPSAGMEAYVSGLYAEGQTEKHGK